MSVMRITVTCVKFMTVPNILRGTVQINFKSLKKCEM